MAGGTVITKPFDKLVFQTPWSNTIVVPFELKYLQAKGIKKIGIITDSGAFGKDGVAVTKANAAQVRHHGGRRARRSTPATRT